MCIPTKPSFYISDLDVRRYWLKSLMRQSTVVTSENLETAFADDSEDSHFRISLEFQRRSVSDNLYLIFLIDPTNPQRMITQQLRVPYPAHWFPRILILLY